MFWGFDFGVTTGYAVVDAAGALVVDGVIEHRGEEAHRYHRLFRKLNSLRAAHGKPRGLGYERGGWTNTRIAVQHGGYYGCLMAFAVEVGAFVEYFAPSTLKLRAAGKGSADKDQMVAAFTARWGRKPVTHDSADAAHVAWCMWKETEF